MSQTYYLVCEYSYEYHDEIYHQPEGEGYEAVILYADENKARQVAQQNNIDFIKREASNRGSGLECYGYSTDEILDDRLFEKFKHLSEFNDDSRWDYDWNGLVNAILEMEELDQITAFGYFQVKPYMVKEVELAE